MITWYGYLHVDGGVHVKRWFDDADIKEAKESDFVERVTGKFEAANREEAMTKAKARLSL